ncbi:MAG: hypothetical protein JJ971_10785 [Balneolaceae bacterium]|nr:hypothetical protein [Balneolaceae bacterium]MBO6546268.1 hypothetical protein [Balneolaceae bacterium]MBO6648627.1 hypothetical protein [Balneolaceae bacterium]
MNVLAAKYSFLMVLFLTSNMLLASNFEDNAPGTDKPILEIADKFNEVRLGITNNTIYMTFSENVRLIANKSFQNRYEVDSQNFEDSEGNFIVGTASYLESNRLEYNFDDIKNIEFKNGKLNFQYKNKSSIGFEDIYSYSGTKAINNFYVEDLEAFIFTLTENLKS